MPPTLSLFSKTFEMWVSLAPASFFFAVGLIIILRWVWRILNWVWINPKKQEKEMRSQGFSGNPYRLLFGDLKDNSALTKKAHSHPMNFSNHIIPRVAPFPHQVVTNFGLNSFTWSGPVIRVLISDPELVKIILTNLNEFQKVTPSNPLSKFLLTGFASYGGEKWSKHRKIVNPSFHTEKLKNMLPAFEQSCNEVIIKWEGMVSESNHCEVDVWPDLQNITRDVISRTVFGSSFEEGRRIFELITQLTILVMQILQTVYIPGWRFLPTKTNRRIKAVEAEIQGLLKGLIRKREKAMEGGEEPKDDLLGILLESNHNEIKEHGNNKSSGLSMEDVVNECKLFYFAGQETTSVLLVWTMVLLGANQQWQQRARDEVFQVFGKNKPTFDGLSHLKVVTMILYETLRLYPPVPLFSRKVQKETKLGDLTLRAGALLTIPPIFIHHDSKIWGDDAQDFKPERFSEGISKATKNQVAFFPFGWGPRICIGQNFAMIEAKLALSMILQRFSFELSPSYTHAPMSIVTIQPQHGAHIILHKLED